jgi:tetratricopeptide (TPR) repeat protein
MARPRIPALLLLTALAGCGGHRAGDEVQREWLRVLDTKRACIRGGSAAAKQAWVDALSSFASRFPDHQRAQAVYSAAELDFARALCDRGRYSNAIPYYRQSVARDPQNRAALEGLKIARERQFVLAAALGELRNGMARDEVAAILGLPPPGWSKTIRKSGNTEESWYYRRAGGGVAGVFFTNGKLFAAEYDGPVKLAR